MQKIAVRHSLYLAFIEYEESENSLFLTHKSGKKYKYSNFKKSDWIALQMANNKGSHCAMNITGNKNYPVEFVGMVPASTINQANKREAV